MPSKLYQPILCLTFPSTSPIPDLAMHQKIVFDPSSELHPLLPKPISPQQTLSSAFASSNVKGYALMFLAALLEATGEFLLRTIESALHYPPSASLLMSAAIYVTCSTIYLYRFNLLKTLIMPAPQLALLALRGFCAASALYLSFLALSKISVGLVLTVFATTPSITTVLAAVFLGTPITFVDVATLAVNMLGVIFIAQPSTLASHPEAMSGMLAIVISSILASAGFVALKALGQQVHFMAHVFSISINLCLIALFCIDTITITAIKSSLTATKIAVLNGFIGLFLKVCINKGMQLISPGPALLVRSLSIPLGFLLGLVFLDEQLTVASSIGTLLVLSSVVFVGVSESFNNNVDG